MKVDFDIEAWAARYKQAPTLVTEQPHPLTCNLSSLVQQDLPQAIALWRNIELTAVNKLSHLSERLPPLQQQTHAASRIILVGCGSSGRLAYWIAQWASKHRVHAILAGDTAALIQSQEGLEDSQQAGAAALLALAPQPQDVVIGLAASGRTPFVLGALQAARQQGATPWLMTNNPDTLIRPQLPEPSLLSGIHLLPLDVGPMALTGSTRLQATTAMQIALIQLFDPQLTTQTFIDYLKQLDWPSLAKTIEWEATALDQGPVRYVSDSSCLLTVLADITERAPTFNVPPLSQANTLWQVSTDDQTALNQLACFQLPQQGDLPTIQITTTGWSLDQRPILALPSAPDAIMQVGLKCLLNCHSTLVMGRRGHYQGNLMTHLAPTNAKLIDRAIRYVLALNPQLTYTNVAHAAVACASKLAPNESLVMRLGSKLLHQENLNSDDMP